MGFKMKYEIKTRYLPLVKKGRRTGQKIKKVIFTVAHDTGNDGSTASGNVGYYSDTPYELASAHTFIDDKEIIECIPALTGEPEKAWHVLYEKPKDNELYGADSNDSAIGVELCYSNKKGKINNKEAYKRYVWYIAYLCFHFKLDPKKYIVGHYTLDPQRKTDPINAFKVMGITWEQFIKDVVAELEDCTRGDEKLILAQWQHDMLKQAIKDLGKAGILNNSDDWVKKLDQGILTNSELAWLNTIIMTRIVLGKETA